MGGRRKNEMRREMGNGEKIKEGGEDGAEWGETLRPKA